MTAYVALLYSIILGGGRRVVMADLKDMAEGIGLKNPRTLVATGNLVFETRKIKIATLEARLEAAFEEKFGRHVDIIARGAADWRKLVAKNPFAKEAAAHPGRVAMRVMRKPIPDDALATLKTALSQGEKLALIDGDPWIYFASGTASPKLLAALSQRPFGAGTFRAWNTVRRLGELVGEQG